MEALALLSTVVIIMGLFSGIPENTPSITQNPTGIKIISTNSGSIKGLQYLSRLGNFYTFFRRIPYALPPVGDLRYEPPFPHPGWSGTLDATEFGPRCIQFSSGSKKAIGSEDCLFLNVAVPSYPSYHGALPVMVYLHGGHFMVGSSEHYNPENFIAEDIVFVTLNYRLNSFGFLNTGDGSVTGNMGLKDQQLAMKWIKNNIHHFNGDANKVTLMGHSAGAASVHYHMLAPSSRGLFSGAISQSGTALARWAFIKNPGGQAVDLAKKLNCPVNNTNLMVECLRNLSAQDIATVQALQITEIVPGKERTFGPTIEAASDKGYPPLLSERPIDITEVGNVAPVPWILGNTEADGLVYILGLMKNIAALKVVNEHWSTFLPFLLDYYFHPQKDEITEFLTKRYFKNAPLSMATLKDAAEMLTDKQFSLMNHDAALMHSKVAPAYLYQYDYQGVHSILNVLFDNSTLPFVEHLGQLATADMQYLISGILPKRKQTNIGPVHGDELPILFGLPGATKPPIAADPDYKFSRKLVSLWSSFARNGVPSVSKSELSEVIWDPIQYNASDNVQALSYLRLDDEFTVSREANFARLMWWKQFGLDYLSDKSAWNKMIL